MDVYTRNRSGRATREIVRVFSLTDHNARSLVGFRKTTGDDADDARVPMAPADN